MASFRAFVPAGGKESSSWVSSNVHAAQQRQVLPPAGTKVAPGRSFAGRLRDPGFGPVTSSVAVAWILARARRQCTGRKGSQRSQTRDSQQSHTGVHEGPQLVAHQEASSKRFREKIASGSRRARKVLLTLPNLEDYEADLQEKVAEVSALLEGHLPPHSNGKPCFEVARSPELTNYRHRIKFELSMSTSGCVGFMVFDPANAKFITVQQSPLASAHINLLMRGIVEATVPSGGWAGAYEAELTSNSAGDAMVSFLYRRPLDPGSDGAWAKQLASELDAAVILRAKQQDPIVAAGSLGDFLVQVNELDGRCYPQHLMDYVFFQTNLQLNKEMQRWVVAQTRADSGLPDGNLLELYCGNGNFTLPAAQNFRHVIATEINRRAVSAAKMCAAEAGVKNVQFAKLSAAQVRRAYPRDYTPGTLLVDPPRSGLDRACLKVAKDFGRIVYISCNPQTLCRDLGSLASTHHVQAACIFDQFPWTDHVEVGVRLERC